MDPRDVQAHLRLGEVFLVNGLSSEAIKEFLLAGSLLSELGEFADARQAYARVLELDPNHPTATREFSNASSALEARAAASTRLAAVGSEQPEAFPEEDLYAPASEEDLYATLETGDDSAILGAPGADSEELGAPELKPVARVDYRIPRHPLPPQPAPGTLHRPLPFLWLSVPGLMQAVRDQILQPPDPEVLSWLPLADLDAVEGGDALGSGSGDGAGPLGPLVESAFGFTEGFSQAIVSTGSSRRRRLRRQLEELGLDREFRAPASAETDVAASLAERIAQKVRQQEDPDES